MSVLLVFTIVHKTNNVLTGLEIMSVNVLVAMSCQMEFVKVMEGSYVLSNYHVCRVSPSYQSEIISF